MVSAQHLTGQADSSESFATMTPTAPSETNDIIPLEPSKEPDLSSDSSSETPIRQTPRGPSKARAKKARKSRQQALTTGQPRRPPLRPAKDILSRIRHDPALDDADFIVGYHDRHADVMELPVALWKGGGDVTEEEFIPQHRILYFRRKADGVKVWDRKERLDLLFHSGNGIAKESDAKKTAKEVEVEGKEGVVPSDDDDDNEKDDNGSVDEEEDKVEPSIKA
ncbi:hypothetical protein MMC07_003526 [Pseudocyphellaria aurata]|nr:hypothetical protein [Pseudocyphellaria aurata]